MAKMPPPRACASVKQTAENRATPQSGTQPAIIDLLESCDLGTSKPAIDRTWGGARNRADRSSNNLTRRQCELMLAAAAYAERTGRTFSRHWTVHYQAAGIPENDGAAFVGRLLNTVGRHVRRAGGDMTAIWARENGIGKRGHVHIAMSLPASFSLRNRTRRWIEVAGGSYRKSVSKVRIIGGTLASSGQDSERHGVNARNVLAYLMKGADDETGTALGMKRFGESGIVIGKRCGWTQNIGAAAQAMAAMVRCQRGTVASMGRQGLFAPAAAALPDTSRMRRPDMRGANTGRLAM